MSMTPSTTKCGRQLVAYANHPLTVTGVYQEHIFMPG